jgi:hypothetical protein
MSIIDPDYECSVNITVNTDVGSPGVSRFCSISPVLIADGVGPQVITSFLLIAGFTIFLAFFPALEEFNKWQGPP